MGSRRSALVELHGAVLLFGLSGLFGKFLDLPAVEIVVGHTAFASLSLLALLAIRGSKLDPLLAHDRLWIVASGTLLALHWATFFQSIRVSTVAVGLLTFSTFPLFVTFLEPWVSRTRLRVRDVATAVLVLAGLLLIVPRFDFGNTITQGALWGTASGLLFAILSLVNKRLVESHPPMVLAAGQNLVATVVLLPLLYGHAQWPGPRALALLALLGIGCTALAHTLFIKSLASVRAQVAAIVTGLEPLYGVVFAFVLLGEVPTWRMLAGGGLILGAVAVATACRDSPKP